MKRVPSFVRISLGMIAIAMLLLAVSCVKSSATNASECSSSSECQTGAICISGRCVGPTSDVVSGDTGGADSTTDAQNEDVYDTTPSDGVTDSVSDASPSDGNEGDAPGDLSDQVDGSSDATADTVTADGDSDTTVSGPTISLLDVYNPQVVIDTNKSLIYLLGSLANDDIRRIYRVGPKNQLDLCGPPTKETKGEILNVGVAETGRLVLSYAPEPGGAVSLLSVVPTCVDPLPDPKAITGLGINPNPKVPWFHSIAGDIVLFAADYGAANEFTISMVPADGSASSELLSRTDALPPVTLSATPGSIGVTKDEKRVFFLGRDPASPDLHGIYSIDLVKKLAVPLAGLTKSTYNFPFMMLPQSNYLIFSLTIEATARTHIYRVPVDGSKPFEPISDDSANFDVTSTPFSMTVSPGGMYVAFEERQIDTDTVYARVVDATSATPKPITIALPAGATVISFVFSHDNKYLFTLYDHAGKRGIAYTTLPEFTTKALFAEPSTGTGPMGMIDDPTKSTLMVWGDLEKVGIVSLHRISYAGSISKSLVDITNLSGTQGVVRVLELNKGGTRVALRGNLTKDNVEQLYILDLVTSALITVWPNSSKLTKFSIDTATFGGSGMFIGLVVDRSGAPGPATFIQVEF
ncbi:MAG: hypothetical protein KC609_26610 [Myxococcales bacterium]|nr:hypothetical protein [Myxococcales bacterium]